MLADADRQKIIECAKKHRITSVCLLKTPCGELIGVDGADPRVFFRFYGDLLRVLSAPVDVYDLGVKSLYGRLFEKEGERIHG